MELNWTAFDKNTETMFEKILKELGIKHKLIKPYEIQVELV